jgi:hypothetical protein
MQDWHTIEFADGSYKLHQQDLSLLANTGIWDLLGIKLENNKPIITIYYIPRYVSTFVTFMHCLRGYEADIHYIIDLYGRFKTKQIVKMLIADNIVYKVKSMESTLVNLAYVVCPKVLTSEQLNRAWQAKSIEYRLESAELYKQIKTLVEDTDGDMPNGIEFMPNRYLQKLLVRLKSMKQFEEFRTDVNIKLPYILIMAVNVLSELTGKSVSKNFEENIKRRIRDDPELAHELYKKLTELGVSYTVQALLSCLTAFADI